MHPNRKFHITDREAMAALVRELGFGVLFGPTSQGLRAVHVPVLLDGDRLRFHVSRGNAVHSTLLAGGDALFVVNGPHAYISPEYYGLEDRVPTWNYVAVELEGPIRTLDPEALIRLVDDLSAEQEARLAPKPAWTRAKMSEGRFEGLLKSITGFEMHVAAWRGTAKVDQDKPQEVRNRIADALAVRGEPGMAQVMRNENPPLHLQGRGTARSAVEGPSGLGEPLQQASPGPPPQENQGRNR
ncbi:MAG TPA: FMN-binding negative transcriptional regulator [Allosphingosinicella sp.]|jgi:transcriptional regulator